MMMRELNLYPLNMIDVIVAYMIGCGDTLPWNFLSLLIILNLNFVSFRLDNISLIPRLI